MKQIGSGTTMHQKEANSETGTQLGEHGSATPSSFAAKVPPATPLLSKSLSPQELSDHREKIAFNVKVILSAYFQPHEAEEIRAAQLAWWCDELQDWTQEQVVWALRKWNRDNPRARPTPGDIVSIMKEARGRRIAAQLPKPSPDPIKPITQEERAHRAKVAAEILGKFAGNS